jgi:hypothetical protein
MRYSPPGPEASYERQRSTAERPARQPQLEKGYELTASQESGLSEVAIAISMCSDESTMVGNQLLAQRGSPLALQLRELLWLRAIFLEQRRRIPSADRRRFDRRADRILTLLSMTPTPSKSVRGDAYRESP